jgi:hypothetical protein
VRARSLDQALGADETADMLGMDSHGT